MCKIIRFNIFCWFTPVNNKHDLFFSTATLENERERGDLSVGLRLAVEKSAKQELSKMVNCKTSTIKANITVMWPKYFIVGSNANFNTRIVKDNGVVLNGYFYNVSNTNSNSISVTRLDTARVTQPWTLVVNKTCWKGFKI